MQKNIRNIAIIAHVDHGKTTLVDRLLQDSGILSSRQQDVERVMDSNDLEKERGITILSKNTAIEWKEHHINIVDTPGHADFGGEVERVLSMVDAVLLLVDAVEGPMPQTRFVTQKAFAQGLNPIVVINKIDRDGARPDWVITEVFDLFDNLGATDEQLDFPIIYTSAINGQAGLEADTLENTMAPLLDMIIEKVAPPKAEVNGPLQMQITSLDYSSYVGAIGIGRITRGTIKANSQVCVVDKEGNTRQEKVLQVFGYHGLDRIEIESAVAGDIVAITGIERPSISDTVCAKETPEMLPVLHVDEPTISMSFQVNNSPFAGKEGKFVTSRQIKDRLEKELVHNVALRVERRSDSDKFKVSGRGELHLAILIETMRREGFELSVSRPEVICKQVEGVLHEPFEELTVDIETDDQGKIMEALGERKADLQNMTVDGKGRVRLDYIIPTRGLIGFHSAFQTITSGTGIMTHVFLEYRPAVGGSIGERRNGVLISMAAGTATAYSLWNLQPRGKLFLPPQTEVYEGMIAGIHTRDNDLVVNVTKGKQLTNVRASGTDDAIILTPPIKLSLEDALEFINNDELVEFTPKSIRLRKKLLKEVDRKRNKNA